MRYQRRIGRLYLTLQRLPALFGRGIITEAPVRRGHKVSLFIRHLDGGSSNIYEAELAMLTSPWYDLGQYGIRIVPSPRHADLLLMTFPLTRNMLGPALATFHAMPTPRRIVTIGAFAPGRYDQDSLAGLLSNSYAVVDLPQEMKAAVVAHIPGDPPHPTLIIETLLGVSLS